MCCVSVISCNVRLSVLQSTDNFVPRTNSIFVCCNILFAVTFSNQKSFYYRNNTLEIPFPVPTSGAQTLLQIWIMNIECVASSVAQRQPAPTRTACLVVNWKIWTYQHCAACTKFLRITTMNIWTYEHCAACTKFLRITTMNIWTYQHCAACTKFLRITTMNIWTYQHCVACTKFLRITKMNIWIYQHCAACTKFLRVTTINSGYFSQ